MTTNLINHLVNLKILSDFIESKLEGTERFWQLIKEGENPASMRPEESDIKYDPADELTTPSDEDFEKARREQEFNPIHDFREDYLDSILLEIENIIFKYSRINPPEIFEIESIYDEYLGNNELLFNYIIIDRSLFKRYVSQIKGKHPKSFSLDLLVNEEEEKSRLNPELALTVSRTDQNKQLNNNPFPQIFKKNEDYQFFEICHEYFEETQANLSFLYRKFIAKGFIYESVGNKDFRIWYDDNFKKYYCKLKTFKDSQTEQKKLAFQNLLVQFRESKKLK